MKVSHSVLFNVEAVLSMFSVNRTKLIVDKLSPYHQDGFIRSEEYFILSNISTH